MNSTKYHSYIAYSTTEKSVKYTYCTCKTGKRTVGTCSHCATIIYYLSNARYNQSKSGKYSIEKIFPQPTLRESDSEEEDNVVDSAATEIDNDITEIESDLTEVDINDYQEMETTHLYPDLESFYLPEIYPDPESQPEPQSEPERGSTRVMTRSRTATQNTLYPDLSGFR